MAISYTDSYGPVVDTGVAVQPTPRPSTEDEVHFGNSGGGEVDTASKLTTAQTISNHIPHREKKGPR